MSLNRTFTESEQNKVVADNAPNLIWISNVENIPYYFNKRWLDYTGLPIEQLQHNKWSAQLHAEDVSQTTDLYKYHFSTHSPFTTTHRLRNSEGHYRWFLNNSEPRFDDKGAFLGYISSSTDINELKNEEIEQNAFIRAAGHEIKTPLTTLTVSTQMLETLIKSQQQMDYIPELIGTMRNSLRKLDSLIDNFLEDLNKKNF